MSLSIQDPEGFEREYAAATEIEPAVTKVRKLRRVAIDDEEEGSENEDFTTVGKGGKVMQYTSEGIFKNLQLVQEARGKKVYSSYLSW